MTFVFVCLCVLVPYITNSCAYTCYTNHLRSITSAARAGTTIAPTPASASQANVAGVRRGRVNRWACASILLSELSPAARHLGKLQPLVVCAAADVPVQRAARDLDRPATSPRVPTPPPPCRPSPVARHRIPGRARRITYDGVIAACAHGSLLSLALSLCRRTRSVRICARGARVPVWELARPRMAARAPRWATPRVAVTSAGLRCAGGQGPGRSQGRRDNAHARAHWHVDWASLSAV